MFKLLMMFILILSTAQAVIWNEGMTAELHWGEAMVLGNYTLDLIDFSNENSNPSLVLVELLEDNLTLTSRALSAGESFSWNDSVRVTARKIVDDDKVDEPYAVIAVQLKASPEIALLLSAEKDVYRGGDMIRLELGIENTGIVDAESMKIALDSKPPLVYGSYSKSILVAGRVWDENERTSEIEPVKASFTAPYLPEPAEFEVRVQAEYEDPDGNIHEAFGGTTFRVEGCLQAHKQVEDSQDFGKSYYVIDSLRNCGNRTLELELSDSTGEDFQTDSYLHWQVNLSPGEAKTVSYKIAGKRPVQGRSLPPAEASFVFEGKTFRVSSESPVVDVLGPFIEGRRSISPRKVAPGKDVVVSLNLSNTGNRRGRVSFLEKIPRGAKLVDGSISGEFMLSPQESRVAEYTLRCLDPGDVVLPPDNVSYHDIHGSSYSADNPPLVIEVVAEKKVNITSLNISRTEAIERETKLPEENSFAFISLVFIIGFWAAFSRYL